MAKATHHLLETEVLSRIQNIELKARDAIHGMYQGMHRSPYFGAGVEYADHRSYNQGDELRHVDWKLYMRTDKFFVKRFDVERDLSLRILLDGSRSMGFESEWGSKLEYAKRVAASLAFLIVNQRDMVGLSVFHSGVRSTIPPKSGRRHLRGMLSQLETLEADGETDLRAACIQAAQQTQRRGIVVVISDFLDDPERIVGGFGHLAARKQEVICFHILDRYEREFPFQFLGNFVDPETRGSVVSDPVAIRTQYLESLNEFITDLRDGCWRRNIDYVALDTAEPLSIALSKYLLLRQRRSQRRTGKL